MISFSGDLGVLSQSISELGVLIVLGVIAEVDSAAREFAVTGREKDNDIGVFGRVVTVGEDCP